MEQVLIDQEGEKALRKASKYEQENVQIRVIMCKVCTYPDSFRSIGRCHIYFDIYCEAINYFVGTSFFTLIPMYISSIVYKFCKYHRMFIHYILAHKVVASVDMYIGIPLNDGYMLLIYLIIAGIFAFLALYYHQKYGGRSNE